MVSFLANDFTQPRWESAALKNAFVLLGKHQYGQYFRVWLIEAGRLILISEHAAAFFLLGNSLRDAAFVCVKQLSDPQLALVICRLYEGEDGPVYRELLEKHVLSMALASKDRWWISNMLWLLRRFDDSLRAILVCICVRQLRAVPSH